MRKAKKTALNNLITYGMVIVAFIICQVLIENGQMTRALKGQLVPICVYVVMAVSLNLTVGISGELSLGHAGFMSVGAFTGAIASAWMLAAFQLENEVLRLSDADAHDRFHARDQGLYRRGIWRHRFHSRRHAGRCAAGRD